MINTDHYLSVLEYQRLQKELEEQEKIQNVRNQMILFRTLDEYGHRIKRLEEEIANLKDLLNKKG